jgi:hypothetical protein
MKQLFFGTYLVFLTLGLWAANTLEQKDPPTPKMQQERTNISPCVKALLDGEELSLANGLKKSSEGKLEVETEEDKVYFNLVLKSYVSNEKPPLYLRFMKVDSLDIQKVLKYAKIGDEIFIEPFSVDGLQCLPSHFLVT